MYNCGVVMKKSNRERINVIFPAETLKELRDLVPAKQRSQLIVQATAEKLALIRQQIAVTKAAGAWEDSEHPELQSDEDLAQSIAGLRSSWRVRQVPFETEKEDVSP